MIRFINLKNQITEGVNSFAFYDTVTDCIITLCGTQVWDTLEEFKEDYANSDTKDEHTLQRFLFLIPENYFRPPEFTELPPAVQTYMKAVYRDEAIKEIVKQRNEYENLLMWGNKNGPV